MIECPKCKWRLPRIRIPKNLRQFLWGGWTCPNCHTELDRLGNPVKNKSKKRKS